MPKLFGNKTGVIITVSQLYGNALCGLLKISVVLCDLGGVTPWALCQFCTHMLIQAMLDLCMNRGNGKTKLTGNEPEGMTRIIQGFNAEAVHPCQTAILTQSIPLHS